MASTQKNITSAVLSAIDLGQQGKIKACKEQLQTIYSCIKGQPFLLWDTEFTASMGKAIVLMIHFDLIDDEDENINLAHWAYLFISKGINTELQKTSPDNLKLFSFRKDRVILLKSFDDFFVDSLRTVYYSDNLTNDMDTYLEHRKVVLSRIPLLILSDIYHIEQQHPNLNNDTYLLEVANYLEQDMEITTEELKEGNLLHQVLFQYILQQKSPLQK